MGSALAVRRVFEHAPTVCMLRPVQLVCVLHVLSRRAVSRPMSRLVGSPGLLVHMWLQLVVYALLGDHCQCALATVSFDANKFRTKIPLACKTCSVDFKCFLSAS